MGKLATPNTDYCSTFPQGSISIEGKIFSTENPPISYSVSGNVATITDATGAIGSVILASEPVPQSTFPAEPNTPYCTGKPRAKLQWSSGSQTTDNPPISYSLATSSFDVVYWGVESETLGEYVAPKDVSTASIIQLPRGIQVDWGNGDIDILTGETWSISTSQNWKLFTTLIYDGSYSCSVVNQWYGAAGFSRHLGAAGYPPSGKDWRAKILTEGTNQLRGTSAVQSSDRGWRLGVAVRDGVCPNKDGWNTNCWVVDGNGNRIFSYAYKSNSVTYRDYVQIEISITKTTVTTDTAETSEREDKTPNISVIDGNCAIAITYTDNTTEQIPVDSCPEWVNVRTETTYNLAIADSTGTIGTFEYEVQPIDFVATCFDYSFPTANYACQGECPSGTEFQCVCPTNNTLYCYGFSDENTFEVLFSSPISA